MNQFTQQLNIYSTYERPEKNIRNFLLLENTCNESDTSKPLKTLVEPTVRFK